MHILITRHGESVYNTENRIGGDPPLSDAGKVYAHELHDFCQHNAVPQVAYTSTKRRTLDTIRHCRKMFRECTSLQELDEINAGCYEDLTYKDVEEKHTKEFQKRKKDKLRYRYPEGESYIDLIERVRPFIEKVIAEKNDIFIVCHRAVTRALLYHLMSLPLEEIPSFEIPLHSLICLKGEPGKMKLTVDYISNIHTK